MATKRAPDPLTFTARIECVVRGVPFYIVMLPASVSRAIGKAGAVPVSATIGDAIEFRTNLVACGRGRHQMFLNARVRGLAGVGTGDRVTIALAIADKPAEEPLPDDVTRALREVDGLAAWGAMGRGKRNEILKWIEQAAMEVTREKRIARAVELALAAREKKVDREAKKKRAVQD